MQLECENDFQVTARQKMGLQPYNHKKLNSTNNLSERGKAVSAQERIAALEDFFISASHDPE